MQPSIKINLDEELSKMYDNYYNIKTPIQEQGTKVISYSNRRFIIHLTNKNIYEDFFNFKNQLHLPKVLFLSYNFNDKELSEKLGIPFNNANSKNKLECRNPLKDLEHFSGIQYRDFEIFIEGIDFYYLEDNFKDIFSMIKKLWDTSIRYHFNIVNVPIEKQAELESKIYEFLPKTTGRIVKKFTPEKIKEKFEIFTGTHTRT